jgi:hypothetical protein
MSACNAIDREIAEAKIERAAIDGKIAGLEIARAAIASYERTDTPAPPPARAERGSVQTAVMECFGDNVKASSADDMCFRLTQFDRSSVLSALRALVKSGKLILADGRYRVAETGT